MEIIPPITHTCLLTSFYISHNKYYSYYYYIKDNDATKPAHSDSDSSLTFCWKNYPGVVHSLGCMW